MSLESWKAEFYQLDANSEAVQIDDITRTRHSLQKWIGLRKENLERHNLSKGLRIIMDNINSNILAIETESCSLCRNYIKTDCKGCPLYIQRGSFKCDKETQEEDNNKKLYPPYQTWLFKNNPESMIAALEATLQTLTTPPNEHTTPSTQQ